MSSFDLDFPADMVSHVPYAVEASAMLPIYFLSFSAYASGWCLVGLDDFCSFPVACFFVDDCELLFSRLGDLGLLSKKESTPVVTSKSVSLVFYFAGDFFGLFFIETEF